MHDAALNNPFQTLQKKRFAKTRLERTTTEKKQQIPAASSQEDDESLFLAAMTAVDALPGQQSAPPENAIFAPLFARAPRNVAAAPCRQQRDAPADKGRKPDVPGTPPHDAAREDDSAIFAKAMSGVVPVRAGGRDMPSPPEPVKLPVRPAGNILEDIVSGKVEFTLAFTEEYIEGQVKGLDPAVMGMLKAGSYSLEGHLDLHGQNLEQAYASLALFIKEAYHNNKRHLLLVTGRGRNSPGGASVIRDRVQSWLTKEPFKRVMLAFATAKKRDGGSGALYILLRKRKKSQGKIVWDRMPSEEELLA